MKNRIYGFFMLIASIWFFYWIYYYFQVLNKGSITINSNIWNYKVLLHSKTLKITFSTNCEKQKCELVDISPIEYDMTIIKDWYDDYFQNFKLNNKENKNIDINLQKTIFLEKVEKSIPQDNNFWLFYKYFLIEDKLFFFKEDENHILNLFLKYDWKITKIYTFLKTDKKNIFIDKVYGSKDYIYIKYDNKDYIYNLQNFKINDFKRDYDIRYVKKQEDNFIFILNQWVFYSDLNLENIVNISLFDDFVIFDENEFLFYVNWDDKDLKNKYNITNKQTVFLTYNTKTKKTIQKFVTSKEKIDKIYIEDNNFFIESWKSFYKIQNLEK